MNRKPLKLYILFSFCVYIGSFGLPGAIQGAELFAWKEVNKKMDEKIYSGIPVYNNNYNREVSNNNPDAIEFSYKTGKTTLNKSKQMKSPKSVNIAQRSNKKSLFRGVGRDTLTYYQIGHASWYGKRFQGKRTASGENYDIYKYTAAHRSLPFGTRLLVRNLENGKEITVKVNDRGPYLKSRIVDLSYAAAAKLGFIDKGITKVGIIIVDSAPIITQKNMPNQGRNKAARLDLADMDNLSMERPDTFSNKDNNDTYDPFTKWEEEGKPVYTAPNKKAIFLREEGVNSRFRKQNNENSFYFEEEKPNLQKRKTETKEDFENWESGPKPGTYSIQVGSFRVKDNAKRLKMELESKFNQPVYIIRVKKWFKVQIGQFQSRQGAKKFQKRVGQNGYETLLNNNKH